MSAENITETDAEKLFHLPANLCFLCAETAKIHLKYGEFKRNFCTNKCVRRYEKKHGFSRAKLNPESKFLYSISSGCDKSEGLQHNHKSLRNLSKAILRTSRKQPKKLYLDNPPYGKEWR